MSSSAAPADAVTTASTASTAAAGLVNVSTHEITSLYKSRTVLLKLLATRGYDVADYEGVGMHEIHTMLKHNQLDMLVSTKNTAATATAGAAAKTYIKYAGFGMHAMKKIQQKDVHNIVDDLFVLEEVLTKDDTLIIVAGHQINDTIVQLLNQMWEREKYFIIIYSIEQLQFNILEHQYVPPHEILGSDEEERMMRRYNITNSDQLPSISRYDPVAQAIGIRPGQICKITRPSRTSIVSQYYRVCV